MSKHSEERPGMGCGDESCTEHYPLPKPYPARTTEPTTHVAQCDCCRLVDALASERDEFRQFVEGFACDCQGDEHDCAPEAEEARELVEHYKEPA